MADRAVDRDPVVYAAGGFVALVAVLSSYATLVHLAELAGWDYILVTTPGIGFRVWASHLWAASIDAYGLCALRVWLRSGLTEDTRRWAQRDAAGALAVSVIGNVAEHLLTAAGVTHLGGDSWSPSLFGVVAVAVVAPVQVARIGHLMILLSRDRFAASRPRSDVTDPVASRDAESTPPPPAAVARGPVAQVTPAPVARPRVAAAATARPSRATGRVASDARRVACATGCNRHSEPVSYDTRRRCTERLALTQGASA